MVFKTICVGSIPATLVIVTLKPFSRRKKALYIAEYKRLRRQLNITQLLFNKRVTLRRMREIALKFNISYRKSRRLKRIKRRSPKTFKFRGYIKFYQNSDKKLNWVNPSKTKHLLVNKIISLKTSHAKTTRPVRVNYATNLHKIQLSNNKIRRRKSKNVIRLNSLIHAGRFLDKSSKKTKNLTNVLLKRPYKKKRKIKQTLARKKITGYKHPQTTRSHKLEYSEKFSATFLKDYKKALINQPFLESYPFFNTEVLVPVLSAFLSQKTFNTSWYDNLVEARNPLTFTREVTQLSNLSYLQQMRNLLFMNTIYFTKKLDILTSSPSPHSSTRYINTKHLLCPVELTPEWNKVQIAQNWSLESDFVRKKNLKAPNAIFVLGKAPTYRMSKNSESPISTSQQNGNFFNSWSRLTYFNNNTLALFTKSNISPLLTKLNRPKPSILPKHLFSKTYTLINDGLAVQRRLSSRKLSHVKPTNFTAIRNLTSSDTKNYTKIIMGMKQAIISVRRKAKGYSKTRPKRLRKQKLLSISLVFSRRRQLLLKRQLKRNIRSVNRFFRWKVKKAALFFTKFTRLSKVRKKHLKGLYHSTAVSSRTAKYHSFNTNIISPSQHFARVKNSFNIRDTYKLPKEFTTSLLTRSDLISHSQTSLFLLSNPLLLKSFIFWLKDDRSHKNVSHLSKQFSSRTQQSENLNTNLIPHQAFNKVFTKKVLNSFANRLFRDDIIPLYQNTLIRFIEFCTGKKAMFQFYPFVNQHIDKTYMVRYKRWLPRMGFYERRLGHRFFLEESLHIIHISFILRDPKIIASWLRAMILRISFWKTRSIFRFLKYLFHNYFIHVFDDVKIKGLKIRLKGKISAAGNSRKRTILYRVGNTSHSEVNLRVVKDFSLINTFTGVMGFQVYLFY